MEQFYKRAEAATILGVSTHTITNYIQDGKLRSIKRGNAIYIPHEDIFYLYENKDAPLLVARNEFIELKKYVAVLQQEVNVLKLGLGFGAQRGPRSDDELMLIYYTIMNSLSKNSWTTAKIYEFADLLISLKEEDISRLITLRGPNSWIAMSDLTDRMLSFIKSGENYPLNGLDTLESRLIGAKNRMCGLIHIALNRETPIPKQQAERLKHKVVRNKSRVIDDFIEIYLKRRLT